MRQPSPPFAMSSHGPLHPSRVDKATAASASSVAATRQKSCNACVRGKRRCDKKAPKCTRCGAKDLDCVYARVPPGADANSVLLDDDYFSANLNKNANAGGGGDTSMDESQPSTSAGDSMPDFGTLGGFVDMPSLAGSSAGNTSPGSSLDYGADSSDASTGMSSAAMRSGGGGTGAGAAAAEFNMHMDDMSGFSIADLLAAGHDSNSFGGGDLWDMHSFPLDAINCEAAAAAPTITQEHHNSINNSNNTFSNTFNNTPKFSSAFAGSLDATTLAGKIDPLPLTVVPRRRIRDLSMLSEECEGVSFNPVEVHDPRSRPGHFVKTFTDMHITFSKTRSLPFLHSRLYASQLPKPVMTAWCAATTYANRTAETKGWTVKLLGDATREVYAEGEKASSPLEKLARVHALLVLNTMRVLDGDIWLRAAAEKEFGVMVEWTTELARVRNELEEGLSKGQLVDKAFPPESWEGWLLLENIRRTIVASISFICLITLLKGGSPDCELWNEKVHFTASRHLWSAQTSVDFYRAWRDKPRFLIEQMQYREFWQYATPEDLDDFTRIMLTVQTGTEAMDHFMLGDTSVKAC